MWRCIYRSDKHRRYCFVLSDQRRQRLPHTLRLVQVTSTVASQTGLGCVKIRNSSALALRRRVRVSGTLPRDRAWQGRAGGSVNYHSAGSLSFDVVYIYGFRLMGGLQAKSMTSQRYRAVTRWRICYYGNVMTTTRWWLYVTVLHLQQYSHRLDLFFLTY